MPSSHLILCCPLLLLPPIPPSIRIFSNESTLHIRWPKYWSFSCSISPSNEHPGLISFRMDQLDLLGVQVTLKGLPQHHSSKASILWRSAFFTVQLSHLYTTTGKTIALTRWTLVGKVTSLLLKILSRLYLKAETLLCQQRTVSDVQQNDSLVRIHVSNLFQILFLFRFPNLIGHISLCYNKQQVLADYQFLKYDSGYMSISNYQFIPSPW